MKQFVPPCDGAHLLSMEEAMNFSIGCFKMNHDLDALRELAQQRGYKAGWAERVYQARLAKRHGI